MTSSGQLTEDVTIIRSCVGWTDDDRQTECDFSGRVDATRDYETNTEVWECPECGTQYAEPFKRSW